MAYVSVAPGELVKVLGTKYKIVRKTAATGRTYHDLEEQAGRGSAYSVRFEKQIISIEGLYYRAQLDMFGSMALVGLNDDELRRFGLPTPPPLTEAEQAASREASDRIMESIAKAREELQERFRDPKRSDERLAEISRLKEMGAITDAEYEAKRKEILDSL
jgi:hypothetical protein